jgi:hypothetical protein
VLTVRRTRHEAPEAIADPAFAGSPTFEEAA